jgi:hypothetical protein
LDKLAVPAGGTAFISTATTQVLVEFPADAPFDAHPIHEIYRHAHAENGEKHNPDGIPHKRET